MNNKKKYYFISQIVKASHIEFIETPDFLVLRIPRSSK